MGDMVDENSPCTAKMHDGRQLPVPAELEDVGFTLRDWPTKVSNFRDDEEVTATYYDEIINLVKEASGADRVLVFDHTVRSTESSNLNSLEKGAAAAAVPRVHCDYTAVSAPRRLKQLAKDGVYSRLRGRDLTEEEVLALGSKRFSFINVWRNISPDDPVYRMPLAVCDTNTVPTSDHFLYELVFKERIGENYSLNYSDQHKWYYYPQMEQKECLVFKVYDQDYDGPRFTFHTAFDDPKTPADAPPRQSIEVRTIAFFDVEGGEEELSLQKTGCEEGALAGTADK